MRRVLFVDRDGTLIVEPPDEQVDSLSKVELIPGVIPALTQLAGAGFELVMVSNQDGRGTKAFPEESFRGPHDFLLRLLNSQGIRFSRQFICPHRPEDECSCRKPATGLLDDYLDEVQIDPAASWVIGDRDADEELALNLGVGFQRIEADDSTGWARVADRILARGRPGSLTRETRETRIEVHVDLEPPRDGSSPTCEIETGIGFFDHMLEQLALHGGFQLSLSCQGDLEVDEHHTVEDVALALGQAIDTALGDRVGIGRYGFVLPMDESLASVAVDLSGRPFCAFEGSLPRPMVGGLPTEMVPHFFRSFSQSLRATLHIDVRGENTHHMIEAAFKGTGRALRPALARQGAELPSSKGVL